MNKFKSIFQNVMNIDEREKILDNSEYLTKKDIENIFNNNLTCGYCKYCLFKYGRFYCKKHDLIIMCNEPCDNFIVSRHEIDKWQEFKNKANTEI